MIEAFVNARLLAKDTDIFRYTTYAFQNIDTNEYILCTRFPNWEHNPINIGEIGILHFREVIGGKDIWYDGKNFIPYHYTGWHFIKFIPINKKEDDLIMH